MPAKGAAARGAVFWSLYAYGMLMSAPLRSRVGLVSSLFLQAGRRHNGDGVEADARDNKKQWNVAIFAWPRGTGS